MTSAKTYVFTDGRTLDRLNPKELLLASTLICTGITVMSILEKKRVNPVRVELSISGELDTPTVQTISVFTSFHMNYNIACRNEEEQSRVSQAVELTQEKYCGGIQMIKKIAPLTHEVSIVSTEQ